MVRLLQAPHHVCVDDKRRRRGHVCVEIPKSNGKIQHVCLVAMSVSHVLYYDVFALCHFG